MAALAIITGAALLPVRPARAQAAGTVSIRYRVVRDAARNDTLNAAVVNRNAVVYDVAASAHFGSGGSYKVSWVGDAFGIHHGAFLRLAPAATLQARLDDALAARQTGTTTITDAAVRALENFPPEAANRPLVAAAVPFDVVGPGGQRAELVLLQRHTSGDAADSLLRNSRLFGTRDDTVRVQVPPNAWMPGDTLYVVENLSSGRAITTQLVLACASGGIPARTTCNPLALNTRGATGYLPLAAGYESVWHVPPAAAR